MRRIVSGLIFPLTMSARADGERGFYYNNGRSVFYHGREVIGANAHTFIELGHGYGKNDFNKFYNGRKVRK